MPSVLFVCTGNQFRSPLAAAHFRRLLIERSSEQDWLVDSAGTWAIDGEPSPLEAMQAAAALGIDLVNHRARLINQNILNHSDLIVTMTRGQREAICSEFPKVSTRVQLLSELGGGLGGDIPDPPSAPHEIPRIMRDVFQLVEQGYPSICQLARQLADQRT